MRVLLIEREPTIAQVICLKLLTECNAAVTVADTGKEAIELARYDDYDMMVLDLTLPDIDGFAVLQRIRKAGRSTPALILSELTDPQARVRALQAGADDVMTKPLDTEELCARVMAIVRRSKGHSGSLLQVGPLELNLDTREVTVRGKPLHLTGKEYSVLELLVMRRGLVLTKDQFLSHLYGGMDEPEIKIIDVFICKLRRKLGNAGASNLIGNVWGRGFIIHYGHGVTHLEPVEAGLVQPSPNLPPIAFDSCSSPADFFESKSDVSSNNEPTALEREVASA